MLTQVAGLQDSFCWDNVVDFRWHRSTKSPHWEVLADMDRLKSIPVSGWSVRTVEELSIAVPSQPQRDVGSVS